MEMEDTTATPLRTCSAISTADLIGTRRVPQGYVLPRPEAASRQELRQGEKAAMRRAGMVYIDEGRAGDTRRNGERPYKAKVREGLALPRRFCASPPAPLPAESAVAAGAPKGTGKEPDGWGCSLSGPRARLSPQFRCPGFGPPPPLGRRESSRPGVPGRRRRGSRRPGCSRRGPSP